jgi:ribosomal protein S18 acetylase RimI-like enzyme
MAMNDAPETVSQFTRRRATLDDMAVVATIHRRAFFATMPHMPALHTPEEDLAYYANVVFRKIEISLAELSGAPAGFVAFRAGWVEHLYILPDHQGRGLGSELLVSVQQSMDPVRLWTFQCNLRARRFYEKHGFRIVRETDGAGNEERQPDILYLWTRGAMTHE